MKRISPGTVTVGVFAILFGLIAAYAARHLLDVEPVQPPAVAGPEMGYIVVPQINLPKYARVREQDVEEMRVPVEQIPEGAIRLKSRALFRLMKETALAGQPLLDASMFAIGDVPTLSERLPAGYRALTLEIDSNSTLNGMIQPESYVDITLTVTGDKPELVAMTTMTLMRAVLVMTTSQRRFKSFEDIPSRLRNVTVAVTPKQANKLILAQEYGTLGVTLRSSAEGELAAEDGAVSDMVDPFDLLGLSPVVPVAEPVIEEIAKTVEIWSGGTMREVTFQAKAIQESLNATAVAAGLEPTEVIPVSSAAKKKKCKDCDKKKKKAEANSAAAAAAAAARAERAKNADRPTLARPIGFEPESSTNVITVPVEAGADGGADK